MRFEHDFEYRNCRVFLKKVGIGYDGTAVSAELCNPNSLEIRVNLGQFTIASLVKLRSRYVKDFIRNHVVLLEQYVLS